MHRRRTGQTGRKKTNTIDNVEHIIVSYNEEDQSYGIEGQVYSQGGVSSVDVNKRCKIF